MAKQNQAIERAAKLADASIAPDLDFAAVTALSCEARQVLARHRPATLGAAARLPGITPATISLLAVFLKKLRRPADAPATADLSHDA